MGSDTPKQFLPLGKTSVFQTSWDRLNRFVTAENIVSVLPDGYLNLQENAVTGGASRQESVYNGLKYLEVKYKPQSGDIVLIHDAARPFVGVTAIKELIDLLQAGVEATTLACPVKDTLHHEAGTKVDRDGLYALQTPQGFHWQVIMNAHQNARVQGKVDVYTDDTAIVEAQSVPVKLVTSSSQNFKITTKEDYAMAQALQGQTSYRTGSGFDVHAFDDTPATAIRLCGVDVPHDRCLKGHSDADVGLHAITDAILGAMALGDIGEHFPPSDKSFKGMDSSVFLKKAATLMAEKNGVISNIDVTLICEAPKITPHKRQMQQRIAEICGIDAERVSVKATTTEKLGFTGRKEGIAAQASVLIEVQG